MKKPEKGDGVMTWANGEGRRQETGAYALTEDAQTGMAGVKGKKRHCMGLGFLVAGAFFLMDPFVSVFDFLPDVIGYLLIIHGLTRLADLDSRMEEARGQFRKLALLAGVRLLTIPFIFGLSSPSEQGVELLLFSFGLAVLDSLVLVSAWRTLAAGFHSLAYRYDGTVPLTSAPRGTKSITERLLTRTLLFMLIKEVLAVLPELTVLTNQAGGAEAGQKWSHLYDYITLMREVSALIVLILGILWLVSVCLYARRLCADTALFDRLAAAYQETVRTKPGLFTQRGIFRALIVMGIGLALTVDFYADGINCLPDALAGVCLILSLLMLRRYVSSIGPCIAGLALFIPVSLVAGAWQSSCLNDLAVSGGEEYTLLENAARLPRDPEAFRSFCLMCVALLLAQLILSGVLYGLYRALCRVVDRYTGLYVSTSSEAEVEALHTSMKKRLLGLTVYGVVCSLFSVVYMATLPIAGGTPMEAFGVLDIGLHILFVVLFFREVGRIREQMEYRFLLS